MAVGQKPRNIYVLYWCVMGRDLCASVCRPQNKPSVDSFQVLIFYTCCCCYLYARLMISDPCVGSSLCFWPSAKYKHENNITHCKYSKQHKIIYHSGGRQRWRCWCIRFWPEANPLPKPNKYTKTNVSQPTHSDTSRQRDKRRERSWAEPMRAPKNFWA